MATPPKVASPPHLSLATGWSVPTSPTHAVGPTGMEWNCGGSWPQPARTPSGFQLGASDPAVGGVKVPEKPLPEVNFLKQQADQAQTIKFLTAEHADLRKELQAALLRLKPPQKDTIFPAGIIKPRAEAGLDVEPPRVQASCQGSQRASPKQVRPCRFRQRWSKTNRQLEQSN